MIEIFVDLVLIVGAAFFFYTIGGEVMRGNLLEKYNIKEDE